MPPAKLEIDCRATLDVIPGKHAYSDIRQINLRSDRFSAAIAQLGINISVVAWLLEKCCQVSNTDVCQRGRIIRPAVEEKGSSLNDSSAQSLASHNWGYSMFVHYI